MKLRKPRYRLPPAATTQSTIVHNRREESSELEASGSKTPVSWLLDHVAGLLSILGIGLYGAIRFGQQIFYSALGVTPEEVGLSYAATISRAAVIFMAMIAVGLLPAALGFGVVWIFNQYPMTKTQVRIVTGIALAISAGTVAIMRWLLGGTPAWYAASLLTMLTMGLVPVIIHIRSREPSPGSPEIGMRNVATGFLPLLRLFDTTLTELNDDEAIDELARRQRELPTSPVSRVYQTVGVRALQITLILLLIVGAFATTGTIAKLSARRAEDGKRVEVSSYLGILGVRAEPVVISGIQPNSSLSARHALFLGGADGRIVLYDSAKKRSFTTPSVGILVDS